MQGTAPIIALLPQVSSRLPPSLQAFTVCPECQPASVERELSGPSGHLSICPPAYLPAPPDALGTFSKPAPNS
jgi:hypothetical protein